MEDMVGFVFIIAIINICVMGWYALMTCGCQ